MTDLHSRITILIEGQKVAPCHVTVNLHRSGVIPGWHVSCPCSFFQLGCESKEEALKVATEHLEKTGGLE